MEKRTSSLAADGYHAMGVEAAVGAHRELSPRSLAGKPLAGFYATPSRGITVLYGMVMHIIRCNTHYFIDNRR